MKQTYLSLALFFYLFYANTVNAQTDLIYHVDSGEGIFTTHLDGTSKNSLVSYTASSSSLAHDVELDVANSHIYVLDFNGRNLMRYDLDGNNSTLIYSYSTIPRDMELDTTNGIIYHTVNGEVFSTNLVGNNKNSLITYTPSATNLLDELELDVNNNHMYLLDVNGDHLTRYNLDGSNSTLIYSYTGGTQYPSDFTTDLANNLIYHISRDFTAGEIFTTDLLGNSKTVLTTFTAGASLLYVDIELDVENNHMYLLSTNGDLLDRYNLDGSNKTTIQSYPGSFPKDIVIFKVDSTLSLNDSKVFNETLSLYPNPSSDFIQIMNIESKLSYTIYNALGAEIEKGSITSEDQIDVRGFVNGLYFITFENGTALQFIKK